MGMYSLRLISSRRELQREFPWQAAILQSKIAVNPWAAQGIGGAWQGIVVYFFCQANTINPS
jgi:hypothetical protein